MTTQLDSSFGIGQEVAYGTEVTPTRFFEVAETFDKKLGITDGSAWQPGKRVKRLRHNVVTKTEVSGDITFDVLTRGLGYLVHAVLGQVMNTLVPASDPAVYQQVHTVSTTDLLTSYTIQKGIPPQRGGSVIPITMSGCMANSLDFDLKGEGVLTAKIGWVGKDANSETVFAAPSYPVDLGPLTNVHATISLGGVLIAPTTTALSSGTTPVNKFSDLSIAIKNNLDSDGFNLGGAGKRTRENLVGQLEITGKATADFDSTMLLDAYWAQTALPLVLTLEHDSIIEQTLGLRSVLEIVLPAIRLKGETPKSNGGAPIKQSVDFEAFDDGSGMEPIYIVYRTLDLIP